MGISLRRLLRPRPATAAIVLLVLGSTFAASPAPALGLGTVHFSSATYSVPESASSATITVSRAGDLSLPTVVLYSSSAGTATPGADYTDVNGFLLYAPNQADASFVVPIVEDAAAEGNETVNLSLDLAVGATSDAPSTAVLTILDNDPLLEQLSPTPTSYVNHVDFEVMTGSPSGDVTADIDQTQSTNNQACSALPAGSLAGKIALISRGACTFNTKAANAQAAGAVGVLVYNSQAGIFTGTVTGSATITIPVMGLTQVLGTDLLTALQGGSVTMHMRVP